MLSHFKFLYMNLAFIIDLMSENLMFIYDQRITSENF